jgi:hydrogenase maturation protease
MAGTRTLVLGLGNEIVSDDGFGPAVAQACRGALAGRPDVTVETASVAGFHLLDLFAGYDRVLIVDVVQTGAHPPGTLLIWPVSKSSEARTLGGSHQTDLETTLSLGRAIGMLLPETLAVLVAEALDLLTIQEALSPAIAAAVPRAAALVRGWVETGELPLPKIETGA